MHTQRYSTPTSEYLYELCDPYQACIAAHSTANAQTGIRYVPLLCNGRTRPGNEQSLCVLVPHVRVSRPYHSEHPRDNLQVCRKCSLRKYTDNPRVQECTTPGRQGVTGIRDQGTTSSTQQERLHRQHLFIYFELYVEYVNRTLIIVR